MENLSRGAGLIVLLTMLVIGGIVFAAVKDTVTYDNGVRKIISDRCLNCHGSDSPTISEFEKNKERFKSEMKGPRMDTYLNLMTFVNGSDTGALMRRLDDGKNTEDGRPGNMYKQLGKTEDERIANLKVIKDWVGGWTLKRKKDITADELKAIRALEK